MSVKRTATPAASGPPDRLPADERREALLDLALELLRRGGAEAVTMGAVATRAEVTRALVYKHFANREDLLLALYRREAAKLDRSIRRTVSRAPDGFEPKLRAFIHAALEAVDSHSPIFMPLRPMASQPSFQQEQHERDCRTVDYYADLVTAELGIPAPLAKSSIAILLSGIASLVAQAHAQPAAEHRQYLEDLYMDLVTGSLTSIARADWAEHLQR